VSQTDELFTARKSLDQICRVPEKIISVYSLEQHVWADANSEDARRSRLPELKTVEEFQIDPVRPFLNDILRNMAAPYTPKKRGDPTGQGYWIQAEFGSGKSHLLCFLSALALGDKDAWDLVQDKEKKAGRGKRESLYQFWEGGLRGKSAAGNKGIFLIVKTLVGVGSGTVGIGDGGKALTEYILDAAKEQIELEVGRNLSLYPAELLADRFLADDVDRYRGDLKKFLKDPKFFDDDEMEDVNDFIRDIQQNKSPEYKRSAGNKLWRFYTEYLKVQPHIDAEPEEVLRHMVETILAEGYSGVLLVLDEVSLFMKNRSDAQRGEDEQTLVVLANRLAKVHSLPIWTVCSAQQALESMMGVKNIIADDRLKLVKLLEQDTDYYDIVLARVREIVDPAAIANYYLYYRRGFTWANSVGEEEFAHFFPFHKPALEVLRAITYELTTTRSAIHFMHQTLRHQIREKGTELIRLWELFDEAVQYEEDPSGVHAGLVAIKTKRDTEYRAYEACRRHLEGQTRGALKVHRDKATKIVQTLFLYEVGRTRQQGLTPEEIANSVMSPREADSSPEENIQHYESICESLRKELRQVAHKIGEGQRPLYRFEPVITGVDPREEFQKARDAAEGNQVLQANAWSQLLGLAELPVRTRQITIDLASGVRSLFRDIAPKGPAQTLWGEDQSLEVVWNGRRIQGKVGMRDFSRLAAENQPLPQLKSDETDDDFVFLVSVRPVAHEVVERLLGARKDPRVIAWVPAELTGEERDRLVDFAGYLKLIEDWAGKETEDAQAVVSWVANTLQGEMGRIFKSVEGCYSRGRVDAMNNAQMEFHVAGELVSIVTPLVDRVLSAVYVSSDIRFDTYEFRREEAVKVINGIVKTGAIPKGAKPNQNISAAQNFGFGLGIMKKSAERVLDASDNSYVREMMAFVEQKLAEAGQSMSMQTLYKNFTGIGGPRDYGLSRRMVQLYLLCLVREGKVRVGLGPKSGLPFQAIDYSNIADIEFSAKVLDAFTDLQKMGKPEDWEVLRPYAERLLEREIPASSEDAQIAEYRKSLRGLFADESQLAVRALGRARSLFERLGLAMPYEEEIGQVTRFFATELPDADDIHALLHRLEQCYGYQAFSGGASSQTEADDLANRLKNYRDMKRFLEFEREVHAAAEYARHPIPEVQPLASIREGLFSLGEKLAHIKDYVDSEVLLRTELVGRLPADPAERGTFGALVRDYTTAYVSVHDNVQERLEAARHVLTGLHENPAFRTLLALEVVPALGGAVSGEILARAEDLARLMPLCPSPARASIEADLASGPTCSCGLTFASSNDWLSKAEEAQRTIREMVNKALKQKADVLLTPVARERLHQGQSDRVIRRFSGALDGGELVSVLIEVSETTPGLGEIISRYLKKIVVKRVELSRFKPSRATIGKEQIAEIAREFQAFLEEELGVEDDGDDVLPMLQLE